VNLQRAATQYVIDTHLENLPMNIAQDDKARGNARVIIFSVVTNFETMARRPGGLPRDQAVRNARIRVQRLSGRGTRPAARAAPSRRAPWLSNRWGAGIG
jgi:hypothetical protein